MQTRSQEYAKAVYDLIKQLKDETFLPDKDYKRYGMLCHNFPLIVRENGLAAAFGFLQAKEEINKTDKKTGKTYHSAEHHLLLHYAQLFHQFGLAIDENYVKQHEKLISEDTNLQQYRHLTQQTLQLAEWFKRYAEGVLKVSADGTGVEDENNEETAHA